jgi:hypothetical protein
VKDMYLMFECCSFDRDISLWEIHKENMHGHLYMKKFQNISRKNSPTLNVHNQTNW